MGTGALDRQIPRLEEQGHGVAATDIEGGKDLLRHLQFLEFGQEVALPLKQLDETAGVADLEPVIAIAVALPSNNPPAKKWALMRELPKAAIRGRSRGLVVLVPPSGGGSIPQLELIEALILFLLVAEVVTDCLLYTSARTRVR